MNNRMKKLIRLAPLALAFAPLSAFAVTVQQPPVIISNINDLFNLVCDAANLLFTVIMILAIIILLYAAFLFLTGGGDSAKLDQARQLLTYAVVGIVVALLAKGLVLVVVNIVSGGSFAATSC